MQAKFVQPLPGFLVVKREPEQTTTESGVTHKENEEEFVIHGTVVATSERSAFVPGDEVVYNIISSPAGFYDGTEVFSIVEEKLIFAKYVRDNTSA